MDGGSFIMDGKNNEDAEETNPDEPERFSQQILSGTHGMDGL
jgi:hypothetical protein